jgi:lysozyme family protein
VGAKADGIIGLKTLAKVEANRTHDIIDRMLDRRLGFLRRLRIWATFGRGWSRRVEGVRQMAMEMIDES